MALVKYNNNSISAITTAGQLATGNLVPISEQTASGSASISFTTGIDSTYPIYKFEFINIHPATDGVGLTFQASTNGGSSYGITATTTLFRSQHYENDSSASLSYDTGNDQAQSTSFIKLTAGIGNADDKNGSGILYLFQPSSSVYVKHFLFTGQILEDADVSKQTFHAGYFNSTSVIDAVQFKMIVGNMDIGTIKLYGIKDS